MRKRSPNVKRCLAALVAATGLALAAGSAGSLDSGFGDDGVVITTASGHLFGVAFQANGQLVAVGLDETETKAWVVRRYDADGTVDATFGATPGADGDEARAVAIDGDGKILVTGVATVTTTSGKGKKKTSTRRMLGLVRFEADGDLDTTFGDGGVALADVGSLVSGTMGLALQSDGKILVSGTVVVTSGKGRKRSSNNALLLVRHEADGSLDTGFGEDGIVIDNVTNDDERLTRGIGIQTGGSIVLAGWSGDRSLLRRYDADGSVDTSFGASGSAFSATGDRFNGIALDGLDRILVAGYRVFGTTDSEGLVARYTAGGSLDTTFADDGIWLSGSLDREELIHAAVTGGKVVTGGMRISGSVLDTITYRLDATGTLDTSFGVGGVGEISSPGDSSQEGVRDLAVNADGDIAMGGESPATGSFSDWFLVRYCGN